MSQRVFVPVALLTLLGLTLALPTGQTCPRICNCYQASEVHCTFRSLLNIPPGLPAHTRRINLGFNSISRIHNSSLAGLKKVELLMLHSNDLHHLTDTVFRDMKSLQILKLSYNKLREISSSLTFSGLTSLLRLYLDHNLLQHIHPRALLQLPSLRLLRLQGNRLHQLHPHTLCTLSLLNTYYFSTLRHLDLSNNSLTTLSRETLATAPLLETLGLQANPWSCDCRINWFLTWNLAHPGLMKCPSGPQCPICDSPSSLQGQALLEQTDLLCTSPVIHFEGRDPPLETEISEVQSVESFREPLGFASLNLADQQGNTVDLSCNVTQSSESQDVVPLPDLSFSSPSPLPLALSLCVECPVERQSYEKLWRILAYYSETALHLEREIMLSKAPTLAYRYRQATGTDGYYHTGVKASVKARPHWLLQPAISIQLNRAQSTGQKVQLIFQTRVSAHPYSTSHSSTSSPPAHPWVLISTNHTTTGLAAIAGKRVELPCPHLSSGNPKVQWILPDGSKHISPSNSLDSRLQASTSSLVLHKVQLSDAGVYYCIAKAGKDIDVLPLRLAVEESSVPPSGEQVGPPVTSTVGEPVILPCKESGSPAPQVSWVLPDGNIVRQGLAVLGGLTIESNGSLSLPNPSQRDAGHYRCIAVNQYGSDSLSMQLELHSQHPPLLRTSFTRGPQSAAGRSTKIRAPLLDQVGEGSGDGEEEDGTTLIGNKRQLRPLQPSPNRRYPNGKLRRRGPMRGPLRRGGLLSSTDQRRKHFEHRRRVGPNKQRIDPQKWADLLAKIRQKTAHSNNNNQDVTTMKPKAETIGKSKSGDIEAHEGDEDAESDRAEGGGVEADTEGSSVDVDLQEEGLHPIHPVFIEKQTHSGTKTDIETGTEIEEGVVGSTEKPTNIKDKSEPYIQMEKVGPQTETATNPERLKEQVTSKPISGTNEIIPEQGEGVAQETNPSSSKIRPQKTRQGLLPNLVSNSQPQSPWNSRRRIGQRRRILKRPRVRPMTPSQPLPVPTNSESHIKTLETTTQQSDMLLLSLTTSSPAIYLTHNDHIRTGFELNSVSPPVSHTLGVSTLKSASSSLTPSFSTPTSVSPTQRDMMTHSAKVQSTADFILFSTPTAVATQSDTKIAATHVSGTMTQTHGTQTYAKTHTASSKHVDRPSNKHREELERKSLGVPYVSHSSSSVSATLFSTASSAVHSTVKTTTATEKITTPLASLQSTELDTTTTNENTLSETTTIIPLKTIPITSTASIIPTSSTTRSATTTFATTTTPSFTSPSLTAIPTATDSSIPSTVRSFTTTGISTTFSPYPTSSTTKTTKSTTPSTTTPSTTTPSTTTTTTTTTRTTTQAKTSPITTSTTSAPSTTTTTMTSTTALSFERLNVGQVEHRGRPVSGTQNKSQFPSDWKNPGANSIPDSHSSRPRWPPSSSLPVVPEAPVVRSRPRIADPHIRTVSFPAESTARLACEAQGEPKPSITWTKVATGAVMSVHSRAQRFEVLPNGTLVIQNVQLQDRGTYICSAHSFLGRDRLLTTLEVWTRPPRMLLASYREATVHQGGDVHLDCLADGVPTPLRSWVLPNRSVLTSTASSTGRITMDMNGTLHISVTLPSDRGMYRCVASNSAGAASASVRVHVSSLPPVMQLPREEHLLLSLGRPVYAHCSARGAPPPTLRWRIPDGTLVRPSQFLHDNLFVLPNGTLHIRKVGPKDLGNYVCSASNAVGADKRIVRIVTEGQAEGENSDGAKTVVTEKPLTSSSLHKDRNLSTPSRPTNPLSSARISLASSVDHILSSSSLAHKYNSTNSPTKINKIVAALPTHLANINKEKPSSFSRSSIGPTNNTKVSPVIINSTRVTSIFPSDKGRASTVLHPMPVSPFSKARIVSTSPSVTTVQHRGDLQLQCTVTGNPSPIIIWRTPSKKLVDMHFSFDQRLMVHPNGTLSIQAVTEKDAGDYLCIARNKVSDDYRLLRVSVATKPAKIEPKQPLNQMVLFGKPLKVDCQASGLPDPAVSWRLPDGTMVNSVLQGGERAGRARRLTVFDNGTLLVPTVGMGEEGEYTCYAENQSGQDTMKVKVKVMMTSAPTFSDDRGYYVVKVRHGETAKIRCQAKGDPALSVTWFSPAQRVIPRSLGSVFYLERVVVVSDGTLEVRQAQKFDTGNYTCRASNSAGERIMVVGLEVEAPNHGLSQQMRGGGWSTNSGPGGAHSSRSGDTIKNTGISHYGFINGATGKLGSNNSSNNDYSNNNGNVRNIVPSTGINRATSGHNPALGNQKEFNRPVSEITTQLGSSVISASLGRNIDIKPSRTGINKNGSAVLSIINDVDNSHSSVRGESVERNSVTYHIDLNTRKASNDANTSRDSKSIRDTPKNVVSSSVSNNGAATGNLGENVLSRSSGIGKTSDNRGWIDSSGSTGKTPGNIYTKKSSNTVVGVVTTVKQQAVKGQTLLLPCPSQGSPPPRLAWLLPGNGVLPAPYYGSRLTVHRNGSLEMRGVRESDGGTLVCLVRSERGETRIQVELEVSEPREVTRSPHRGLAGLSSGSLEVPRPGASLDSPQSLNSRSVLPEKLLSRIPATRKPLHRGPSLAATPRPLNPPPSSTVPRSEPEARTRTAPLVSIINGETLRLACPASQTQGHTQGSLSWTMPSGKVLSRGESSDSGRYLVQEDGTLTVQRTSVFDRGTYTCRSISYNSSSVSAITVPVIVIAYPPRITRGPSPVTYTRPGVAVELPCLTIATPRAMVTWETPDLIRLRVMGQARVYGNRYLSPQGSLVIQNPTSRDTGFYRCTANNIIGVDTKATYLHVI